MLSPRKKKNINTSIPKKKKKIKIVLPKIRIQTPTPMTKAERTSLKKLEEANWREKLKESTTSSLRR